MLAAPAIGLEDLPDASAVIDHTGRLLVCNQEWRNLYSTRNFLWQLTKAGSRLKFRASLMQLFRERGGHCVCDFLWSKRRRLRARARALESDGSHCLVQLRVLLDVGAEQFESSRPVLDEPSDYRRQLSLSQSAISRLRAILESAPVAVVAFTLEGLVSSWNPAAETIFGWKAEEVLLQESPFADELSRDLICKVMENRSTITRRVRRRRKNGGQVDLSLSVCPLLDESGLLTGLLEVAEDITDRVSQELLTSNQAMLASREAERLNLAREIHDGPLQDLMVVGFSLAEARQAGASKNSELAEIQSALVQVARGLRAVVRRLRPAGLEEFGLVPSIEGALTRLARDYPEPPETHLDLEAIVGLTSSQELCLFRIVQEGYQNCLRHAKPDSVTISLRRLGAEVELLVHDDGRGFSVPSALSQLADSEHYGLLGMQERTLLLGGTFALDSRPGNGTRIRVLIPLT